MVYFKKLARVKFHFSLQKSGTRYANLHELTHKLCMPHLCEGEWTMLEKSSKHVYIVAESFYIPP